jgi:protein-S-isoprenylcysteine O-methyltransferase Ste14
MKAFAFSLVAYVLFLLALAGAIVFLGGWMDHGAASSWPVAVVVDLGLLGLFAVQHTVMARRAYKVRITHLIPPPAERSTYVLAASVVMLVLFWQWQPLPGVIWSVGGAPAAAIWGVYTIGWLVAIASTFMIDHADLFGLRQGWLALRGRVYAPPPFQTRWLYSHVRHPLMTGFLIVFWATPRMTVGHLLFAAASTAYIAMGVWFEERDLIRELPAYREYRSRVGAIVPRLRRRPGLRSQDDQGLSGPGRTGARQVLR